MCRPVGRAGLGRGGACGYSREGADRGRPGACRLAKLVRARRATLTAASAACSVPVYGSCAQHGWGGHTCGGAGAATHRWSGRDEWSESTRTRTRRKKSSQATQPSLPRIDDHARPSKAKFCGTQPSYNNFPCDNLQNDASPRRCHARLTTAICRKNPTLGGAGERERPLQKKASSQVQVRIHTPKTTDAERWTHATAAHPPTPRGGYFQKM